MRPPVAVIAEQQRIGALQRLDPQQRVDRQRGHPCQLHAIFAAERFRPEKRAIRQGQFGKVPCVGVLGIEAAGVAFEPAPFQLKSLRQRGRNEIGLLQDRAIAVDRNVGVEIEIGVNRSKDQQLGGVNVETVAQPGAFTGESGDAATLQCTVFQVGNLRLGIQDQRDIGVVHQRAAEEPAVFSRTVNGRPDFGGFAVFQHQLHFFDGLLLSVDYFSLA